MEYVEFFWLIIHHQSMNSHEVCVLIFIFFCVWNIHFLFKSHNLTLQNPQLILTGFRTYSFWYNFIKKESLKKNHNSFQKRKQKQNIWFFWRCYIVMRQNFKQQYVEFEKWFRDKWPLNNSKFEGAFNAELYFLKENKPGLTNRTVWLKY